jgi:hypothetical protein
MNQLMKSSPRFDWYDASLSLCNDSALNILSSLFTSFPEFSKYSIRPRPGYSESVGYGQTEKDILPTLNLSSVRPPLFHSSGNTTTLFVYAFKALGIEHSCPRVDSCIDFLGDWDSSYDLLAENRGKSRTMHSGDFHDKKYGRTFYVGSPSSAVRVRLYEKGIEQRIKRPDLLVPPPSNWLRFEVQFRPPKSDSKRTVAALSPSDIWGVNETSRQLYSSLQSTDIKPFRWVDDGTSSKEAAVYHMLRQYGPTLQYLKERLGSWDDVGVELGRRLDSPGQALHSIKRK